MKQTATVESVHFLSIILGIGLVASLLLNIYQLSRHNDGWAPYAEAPDSERVVGLQQQLLVCQREGTRKDSVIAGLKQGPPTNPYPAFSARNAP